VQVRYIDEAVRYIIVQVRYIDEAVRYIIVQVPVCGWSH